MAVITTVADRMLELLQRAKENRIPLANLVKKLKTDAPTIERWASFLKDYISVEYPTNILSKPYVKLIKVPQQAPQAAPPKGGVISSYSVAADNVTANVDILSSSGEPVPFYKIQMPELGVITNAILRGLSNELTKRVPITIEDISDQRRMASLKETFRTEAHKLIEKEFIFDVKARPGLTDQLAGILLHNCYGLGDIELLMSDDFLEEICINSSHMPIGAYHIKHGWVRTNVFMPSEKDIYNLSAQIARKAGTNITNLEPLMDAYLLSGDRANATLFPVSSFGNTITIRKFARVPWTIVSFLRKDINTISTDMAALLWLCVQYELNILVTGGTASGKTSMLNALCSLIPANQRIVSIEGTRELNLPEYLHWNWIPMTTRNKNPEGRGEITMLDLIANSLRMRPDRIIMGEVRRKEEAEVLFEAMHTGHSVYSTVHADTSRHLVRRMTKPPFELPVEDMESIDLIVVQFRDRRKGIRRTVEIAEILQSETGEEIELNYLYRWDARSDSFERINDSQRLFDKLNLYTGMTNEEIRKDLKEKKEILDWMRENKIDDINAVGETIGLYYQDKSRLLEKVRKSK